LLTGDAISFYPDNGKRHAVKMSRGFLELSQGYLDQIRNIPPMACVQSAAGKLEERTLSDVVGAEPGKKNIASVTGEESRKVSEDKGDPKPSDVDSSKEAGRPSPAKPDTITEMVSRESNKDTKPPASKSSAAITAVCGIDTLQPMFLAAAAPKTPQPVGLRNNEAEAEEFDFVSAVNDAVPLNATSDLTRSKGKLVPYEAVGTDNLWVSLGTEEPRANAAAVKLESLVRMIVVGGSAEVAMSGLGDVGMELKKLPGARIRLSIEWYVVGPSGAIGTVSRYTSFEQLVKVAAEKAAGSGPDLLNAEQLLRLLDDVETRLKSRTESIEKVFWIKGAYSIPSSIPQRFEKFIKAASSSEAIRGGTVRSSKWFVLVTARMTGFSINYLKEPIYSLQIGELVEEGDAALSEPRRFIRDKDTSLLATRLQVAAVPMPAQTSGAVIGKRVLRAADVFEQRGYLLSRESIKGLQNHLKLVANRWEEPASSREQLAAWAAGKAHKPAPSVVDLLQSADDGASQLRLPRILPDWARKAIKELTPDETAFAGTFIVGYRDRVDNAAARINGKGDHCRLFYAPETFFSFGGNP
jgi:hypothetical protein